MSGQLIPKTPVQSLYENNKTMFRLFVCLVDRRDLNLPKGKQISKRCYYNFTGVIVILLNALKNFIVLEASIGHLEI